MKLMLILKDLAVSRRLLPGLLLAILAAGALFAWWMTVRADLEMREDLLGQTRLVAGAVDLEYVMALYGTEADLESVAYLRLKEQFASIRAANPQCRFVYLLGRKADGTVFIFVDSEPAGSEDESPPGQVYEEISEEYLRAFDTKTAMTVGPVTDRWGTWVTGLVPLTDPQSGEMLAVLGMDIYARDWKLNMAARAAVPVAMTLVLMIGLLTVVFAAMRTSASPKPVMRRLLPPMAVLLALLVGGAFWSWIDAHDTQLRTFSLSVKQQAVDDLQQLLTEQASALEAMLELMLLDSEVTAALKSDNREQMLAVSTPMFEILNARYAVTHFCFSDVNRVCLLQFCNPEKYGDRFDHFTALEAERTGSIASGIELGPLGTFTLRAVTPVFEQGQLLGYLELGKEVEDILDAIVQFEDVEMALLIKKEAIDRSQWESGMAMLGRESDWDRMPDHSVIYASVPLPDEAMHVIVGIWDDHTEFVHQIRFDGKYWKVLNEPVKDVSGRDVGQLIVLHDITKEKTSHKLLMVMAGAGASVLLAMLLGLVFVMLRRADAGILAQQAELRESEERFKVLHNASFGGIAIHDKGIILECNQGLSDISGYGYDELIGMDGLLLIAEKSRETVMNNILSGYERPYEAFGVRKNREEYPLRLEARNIPYKGKMVHVVEFRDITEQKQAEDEIRLINQQLEKVNAEKDKLFAIIAHDLKSPMFGLLTSTEMLASQPDTFSQEEIRLFSTELHKSVKNTLALLEDLLQWARISQGSMDFCPEKCTIDELVNSSLYTARDMAGKKSITIQFDIPEGLSVLADQPMIKTVIRNVLFNAVKFTQRSGNISITAGQTAAFVEVCTRDNGIGMSENILSTVFSVDKYKRQPGTDGEKGTGLGLILCKEFVEKHGGQIWVESEQGKGTKVFFTLPGANGA